MLTYLKRGVWILLIALVFWLGILPHLLLSTSSLAEVPEKGVSQHFVEDYQTSKERFELYPSILKEYWDSVQLESKPIGQQDLAVEFIEAKANKKKENLLILTSGIHGIEGFTGSAMLDYVTNSFAPQLNADNTGLVMVHAVNPWGMKHERRFNEHNVDLNRNFIYDWDTFDTSINKEYPKVEGLLESNQPVGNLGVYEASFLGSLVNNAAREGIGTIEDALLTGQYTNEEGVYFGGKADEPSTAVLKQLYKKWLGSGYEQIIHIDLHTGYGPRYEMSIFSSPQETMTELEAEEAFQYSNVLTPASEGFYVTKGDNTDYINVLKEEAYPNVDLYSTTFEFGTLGDGTMASIQSLKRTVTENRMFHNGVTNVTAKETIENQYKSMFYPHEEKWRTTAIQDFQKALTGVLHFKDIIDSEE